MNLQFKTGDKVIFNNDKITDFVTDTTDISPEIDQYRKLVLAGAGQTGTVKEAGISMTTVAFEDGWELPVPTKYLVLLQQDTPDLPL